MIVEITLMTVLNLQLQLHSLGHTTMKTMTSLFILGLELFSTMWTAQEVHHEWQGSLAHSWLLAIKFKISQQTLFKSHVNS